MNDKYTILEHSPTPWERVSSGLKIRLYEELLDHEGMQAYLDNSLEWAEKEVSGAIPWDIMWNNPAFDD